MDFRHTTKTLTDRRLGVVESLRYQREEEERRARGLAQTRANIESFEGELAEIDHLLTFLNAKPGEAR